eukprot:1002720-Rhodomonas_salina.1
METRRSRYRDCLYLCPGYPARVTVRARSHSTTVPGYQARYPGTRVPRYVVERVPGPGPVLAVSSSSAVGRESSEDLQ